jgi:hypothetical protein
MKETKTCIHNNRIANELVMNARAFPLAALAWLALSPLAAHAETAAKSDAESLVASKRAAGI